MKARVSKQCIVKDEQCSVRGTSVRQSKYCKYCDICKSRSEVCTEDCPALNTTHHQVSERWDKVNTALNTDININIRSTERKLCLRVGRY